MPQDDLQRSLAAVWRIESPRILAALTRMLRDIDVAEELAQDSLVAALEHWPRDGVPDNPGAWLMATAKRRAIDRLRQRQLHGEKLALLAGELAEASATTVDIDAQAGIDDDLLRLMFVACHTRLAPEARVALTLRLLGGLTTAEIARAFLLPEPTIAQRIVRAKRSLGESGLAFEIPQGEERLARLDAVLGVIYLIFNEGYSASSGDDWIRPGLCEEALRLGRTLAGLMPGEAEVHGLLALMELQASRLRARTAADGSPVLLAEQDRARWDWLLIGRGMASLDRALRLAPAPEPYTLQAAIAACHARATQAADTDWQRIAALYGALAALQPSPVIELNRAVALGMAQGPAAGLAHLEGLGDAPELQRYHLLPAVRGDLLFRLGRFSEARDAFERAAALAGNLRDQTLMRERAARCGAAAG